LLRIKPSGWRRWVSEDDPTTPQPPPLKRRGSRTREPKAPSSSEEGVGGGGVAEVLRKATTTLAETSDTPRLDAELLMALVLNVSRSDLLLRHMADSAPEEFSTLLVRRLNHEPVAYILGHQDFFGLNFLVTPDVLIPRGDSEVLVEVALKARPHTHRVLDCGTGSGALVLAVLANLPEARGIGIDRSLAALGVAAVNAARLGLKERSRMMHKDWEEADWAADLGRFDLILANPPYVETIAEISPSVRNFEPGGALFSGSEGLDDYRILIPQLPALLTPGGVALVEIGHTQADAVTAIAAATGLTAKLHRDLANRPRVLELVPRHIQAH
jgi:release factor glutamine methyltransferase